MLGEVGVRAARGGGTDRGSQVDGLLARHLAPPTSAAHMPAISPTRRRPYSGTAKQLRDCVTAFLGGYATTYVAYFHTVG
jgi:hypothetical protein